MFSLHPKTEKHIGGSGGVSLARVWEEHIVHEFIARDVDATMHTMAKTPRVIHVPVATGGFGRDGVRQFYSTCFIGRSPEDSRMVPISRTIGADRVIEEVRFCFTHDIEMPWMLPGIAPTGRRVEIPLVAVVAFRDGRIDSEHTYWDQASVLAQIGLLDPAGLPILAAEQAQALVDRAAPLNRLILAREA